MALGGIETSISDPGGTYRRRLQTMTVLTIGGALGCFLGTLAAANIWISLVTVSIWGFIWGLIRNVSQAAAPASALCVVIFLCALGQPDPFLAVAIHRVVCLLVGCIASITLAMALWPFRPYAPA
jgi:glycerol-3-phosphate acyltransferase PlsY